MNINQSPHFMYANQSLNWLPSDSEKRYQTNLERCPGALETHNWIGAEFTYTFNSHGFRCDEFTSEPSAVFLGCSYTQGIGLPVEHTWASIVAKHLGLACYNLGIGGTSNDTAFRLAYTWLEVIQPKLVVLCTPSPERLELLSADEIYELLPHTPKHHPGQDFYKHWIDNKNNAVLNRAKNVLAIEALCQQLGIRLITVKAELLFSTMYIDLARDLMHPGRRSNAEFAQHVLQMAPRTDGETLDSTRDSTTIRNLK